MEYTSTIKPLNIKPAKRLKPTKCFKPAQRLKPTKCFKPAQRIKPFSPPHRTYPSDNAIPLFLNPVSKWRLQ